MENIFPARGASVVAESNAREFSRKQLDLGKSCQQATNRELESGFRLKIFSPLGASL
jgi:hypothetical protein